MNLSLGLSIGATAVRRGGGGGSSAPALPTVNTTNLVARWQADHSTVTKSGSEVLTATNIVSPGTSDLARLAAGQGAIEMTETNPTSPMYGRKFWRFDSRQAMIWTLNSITTTNMAVFLVCRALRSSRGWAPFSIGASGAGNTNSAVINISVTGSLAPWLRNCAVSVTSVATGTGNAAKHMMGCQPQVIGLAAGSGAGSTRWYMNNDVLTVAGPGSTTFSGGALGIYAHSPGAVGNWAEMDVFDALVYNSRPSNAVADSIAAALVAGYGIPAITDSMVFEGDSITQGFPGDANPAYQVTASSCITGGGWMDIPSGYRVLNVALSGDKTSSLYDQQIAANSAHSAAAMIGGPLSGHNRLVVQIGVNDATSGNSFNGTIAGTVLTVNSMTGTSGSIGIGDKVVGIGVTANTVISSFGTGTGGVGTYNLNNSSTTGPVAMTGGRTADNIYNTASGPNSFVNLIASATNGYKLNYDKIFWCVNIAFPGGNGVQASTIDPLRALIRSAPNTINTQFHTDTGTTAANLNIIDLTQITMPTATPADSKVFDTAAAVLLNKTGVAPATAIYQDDTLHPTGTSNIPVTGNEYMVKGGVPLGGTGVGLNSAFL